jgi:carboxypeptidase D
MRSLVEEFPSLASLVVVGNSSLGQEILGIQISRGVEEERELLKPKVRYSGNMHGNEPVGREMLNHFAEVLLRGYGVIEVITSLINETDITIIPTINPDGFDRGDEGSCSGADYHTGRFNEGNRDLNRDFPTWRDINSSIENLYEERQPETQAMMSLILSEPWVLSANFHDGAVVASYPYDDYRDYRNQIGISHTPDHLFFKHLASTYATNHLTMMNQSVCERWRFEDGITNGADWYPLNGGMQDFNYIFSNDMEITLELSCCKYPRRSQLNLEWERNKESLVQYLQQVHRGVKGVVHDSSYHPENQTDSAVAGAEISVETVTGLLGKNVSSSSRGEFWRLLLPGEYRLTAYKDVCSTGGVLLHSDTLNITLTEDSPLVVTHFILDKVAPCGNGPR